MPELPIPTLDLGSAVRQRYGEAAHAREAALCCPVSLDLGAAGTGKTAVCEKTFGIYAREPYRGHLDLVHPTDAGPVCKPGDCC